MQHFKKKWGKLPMINKLPKYIITWIHIQRFQHIKMSMTGQMSLGLNTSITAWWVEDEEILHT